ncbi:MAG: 50S ribosomal protein L18 [Nanoarchaeota archaeon]
MKVQRKRRREYRTDYKKRIGYLKSDKPRLVFRLSNKKAISQYVQSQEAQDSIEINLDSKELLKYGWPENFAGSLKSITACYLLGYLIGKKIIKEKKETPILDFGMINMLWKTKPYSFLKGVIDSGIKLECPEEAFPEQERIQGKNLKQDFSSNFEKIKSKIDKEI